MFKNIHVIANNKTVEFYLKNYFPNLETYSLSPALVTGIASDFSMPPKYILYDFVYMARIESGKGIEYLYRILCKISVILKRRIHLAIVGKTCDSFSEKELKKLLEKSNESDLIKISYLGWADQNKKRKILTKSGVFLYPSRYDNYPTVLNEALFFGLPVVTWDIPFYRLNYAQTKAVQSVPLYDFQSFAGKAVETVSNREKLSKEVAKFVDSFGTISEMAISDMRVFKEIIDKENDQNKFPN